MNPPYKTKLFWQTLQQKYQPEYIEFFCHASGDFSYLWNYNADFRDYVYSHANTFLTMQTPEFAHNVNIPDCDVVFNTCGRVREVRLAFLEYMVNVDHV